MPNIDIEPTQRMLDEIEILLSKYIICDHSEKSGLLIAGSSVLALLTNAFMPNDIDIFVIGGYARIASPFDRYLFPLDYITKKVRAKEPEYIGDGSTCLVPNAGVNYILDYPTPKEAMLHFDLSLCQCGLFYTPFTGAWRFVASTQCLMDIDQKIIRVLRKAYATVEHKEARLNKYKTRFPDWKVVEGNGIFSDLEWAYQ